MTSQMSCVALSATLKGASSCEAISLRSETDGRIAPATHAKAGFDRWHRFWRGLHHGTRGPDLEENVVIAITVFLRDRARG